MIDDLNARIARVWGCDPKEGRWGWECTCPKMNHGTYSDRDERRFPELADYVDIEYFLNVFADAGCQVWLFKENGQYVCCVDHPDKLRIRTEEWSFGYAVGEAWLAWKNK